MSTESKKYRAEMRAKANRLGNMKSPGKLDASSWSPGSPLNADKKTGARPIRAKAYKHGGRIQGDRAPVNAGKAPRANGGALSVHDTVDENKDKKGSFHDGGYKKGGKAEKACGGGRMAKGGKAVDPMMTLRTKRTEALPPSKGAAEAYEKRTGQSLEKRPPDATLHAKGGEVAEKKSDKAEDKKEIKTAIHKHDKQMHGGKFTKGLKKGGEADSDGGRVERAEGGKTEKKKGIVDYGPEGLDVDDFIKRNQKTDPNFNKPFSPDYHKPRSKRAKGGRAKGATKINIIIGPQGGAQQQPNMPPPQAPVRPPPPPQNASPPPMGGPPPGMPPGPPPGPPPGGPPPGMPPGGPMMRARGGRTGYMSKDAGAGSGLGRLRKAKKEGQEMPVRG